MRNSVLRLLILLSLVFSVYPYDFETDSAGNRILCEPIDTMWYLDIMDSAEMGVNLDICLDSTTLGLSDLLKLAEKVSATSGSLRLYAGSSYSVNDLGMLAETGAVINIRSSVSNLGFSDLKHIADKGNVELLVDSAIYNYSDLLEIAKFVSILRVDTQKSVKLDLPDFYRLGTVERGNVIFLIDHGDLDGRLNLNYRDVRLLMRKINVVLQ